MSSPKSSSAPLPSKATPPPHAPAAPSSSATVADTRTSVEVLASLLNKPDLSKPIQEYPEYKAWVASGGLDDFAKRYNLDSDMLARRYLLPTPIVMAYLDEIAKIPGLWEKKEAERKAYGGGSSIDECREIMKMAGDFGSDDEMSEDEEAIESKSVSQEARSRIPASSSLCLVETQGIEQDSLDAEDSRLDHERGSLICRHKHQSSPGRPMPQASPYKRVASKQLSSPAKRAKHHDE